MKSKEKLRLEISGLCGMFAPIFAFGCILLSIGYAPNFSWTDNALSDLGVMANPTSTVFNLGLIVGGILAIVFASGLFIFYSGRLAGRVGALLFLLDALALTAIGIFPESSGPMHLYASVVFFALFPLAMFFMTAAFVLESKKRNGLVYVPRFSVFSRRMDFRVLGSLRPRCGNSRDSLCIGSLCMGNRCRFQNADHEEESEKNVRRYGESVKTRI